MEPDSWLGVELRHLAALEAVARLGTFGRAAESLGYTQSAISQQIQTLERLVGERLLERPGGPRAVSLTEAGALLLRHAESIIARLHAAQADMTALSQGQGGALRIGTFQSVGAKVLPEVMRRFLATWPHVELDLTESTSDDDLLRLIERGELELSFAMLPTLEGPFESQQILSDPYVLLLPADHELAGLARTNIAELGDLTLIGNRACRSTALAEGDLVQRGVSRRDRFSLGRQRDCAGTRRVGVRRGARSAAGGRSERSAGERARDRARDPRTPDRTRVAP